MQRYEMAGGVGNSGHRFTAIAGSASGARGWVPPAKSLHGGSAPRYTAGMDKDFRAVILHGFSDEEAVAIMRAVKTLGFGIPTPAFATTTPTNLGWKMDELLKHLAAEHAAMKERMKKA
jgi:hypothetical protein